MIARPPSYSRAATRHARLTRRAHFALAICVLMQLLTSQFMEGPHRGRPGNFVFTIHEIFGLAALACAFFFWCVVALRRRGTPVALLFPWFSPRRIGDVFRDAVKQLGRLLKARLPEHEDNSPLASTVHGLGLLLMSAMAITGTVWFIGNIANLPQSTPLSLDIIAHHLLANLVWAYLIGHALLALVHHVAGQSSLATMWSLKRTGD